MAAELVTIEARLVGNVSGTVYAQNQMSVETTFKDPELYCGECLLAIPCYPAEGDFPLDLDPTDTKILLQFRTNSPSTEFGREEGSPFAEVGKWWAVLEERPKAVVEIPSGIIS